MSGYVPTDWVDDETDVDAVHLDKIEQGIASAHAQLPTKQPLTEKAQPNGYPSLGADGKVPAAQLPPIPPAYVLRASLAVTGKPIADCNAANENGWYVVNAGANCPPGTNYGFLHHEGWDQASPPGHAVQLWTPLYDAGGTLWLRISDTYVWKAWKKVAFTGDAVTDAELPARIKAAAFTAASVSDANSAMARESGWYNLGPGSVNGPDAGRHWLLHSTFGSTEFGRQIAYHLYDNTIFSRPWGGAWAQVYPPLESTLPARLQQIGPLVTDCNVVLASGWGYTQSGASANTPYGAAAASGPWGVLETVMMNGTDNGHQRWWQYGTEQRYLRSRSNGVWGAWQQSWPLAEASGNRLGGIGQYVADCNVATANGWYYVNPGVGNSPGGSYYALRTDVVNSPVHVRQTAYDYQSDAIYQRRLTNSVWTWWTMINGTVNRRRVGGTAVVTPDANGIARVYFVGAGINVRSFDCLVVCNGDHSALNGAVGISGTPFGDGFNVQARDYAGNPYVGAYRVNWSAEIETG